MQAKIICRECGEVENEHLEPGIESDGAVSRRRCNTTTTGRSDATWYSPIESNDRNDYSRCSSRVYKAGLCAKHWQSMKLAKAEKVLNPAEPVTRCGQYKCFKTAVISIEGTMWCMSCFNYEQKRLSKLKNLDLEPPTVDKCAEAK